MNYALLLFVVGLASQVAAGDQAELLSQVCADQKNVELTRASELSSLVAGVSGSQSGGCSDRIRAAIVELDQLINSGDQNVCSPGKIEQIRAFYTKFVDKKSLANQQEAKLPKALKNLFLSYGFGVSRVCKASMIGSLLADSQRLLNEADFDQINSWTSDNSPLVKMIKNPKDIDDLVLPRDILALLQEKAGKRGGLDVDENQAVALQPATGRIVKKIQAVCERRFRPIYEQLILPLVSLSRVGLNYKGDEMSQHLEELKTNSDVQRWYRIVYLCEAVRTVEVFVDSESAMTGGCKKMVHILSSEEAEQLRASQPTGADDQTDVERIDYQPGVEHKLEDLIVDSQDKNLRKLVDKFEAHKSELRRVRSKVVKQMFAVMKEILKNHKVSFFKGLLKGGNTASINEELIKAIDEQARRVEQNDANQLIRVKRDPTDPRDFRYHDNGLMEMGGLVFFLIVIAVIVAAIVLMVCLGG